VDKKESLDIVEEDKDEMQHHSASVDGRRAYHCDLSNEATIAFLTPVLPSIALNMLDASDMYYNLEE
jgi:hypothetical protein